MDVVLVNMPFSALCRPSAALGLLQAILARAEFSTKSIYANLWFAECVELPRYQQLEELPYPADAIMDWLFRPTAFPGFEPDDEAFLQLLAQRTPSLRTFYSTRLLRALRELQKQACEFVDEVADHVLDLSPSIVGCTSTFRQHVASLALLRRLKQYAPETITVLGGANCETIMGHTIHRRFDWVDYVVSGEADRIVTTLFQSALEHGASIPASALPEGVFAPVHRWSADPSAFALVPLDGAPRATSDSLEHLPTPNYDDYFSTLAESSFADQVTPGLVLESSRGCWWGEKQHCTFCGLNGAGMRFRSRSSARVHEDLEKLAKLHGVNRFYMVDNILNLKFFDDLIPSLSDAYRLFFECKSNLNRQQVQSLAKAGVRFIQPGIESLSSACLASMKKGVQAWQNVQLLKWCGEEGVRVYWNYLVGLPGEHDEWHMKASEFLPLIHHLQPPAFGGLAGLAYHRYSPYHTSQRDFGLNLQAPSQYRYVYPLPTDTLNQLVYEFENVVMDEKGEYVEVHDVAEGLGLFGLENALRLWFDEFKRDTPPKLVMHDNGRFLEIFDTRSCATSSYHQFDGIQRDVVLMSDTAPTQDRLIATIGARSGSSPGMVEEALADLLAKRILGIMDRRVIGLAVRPAGRELPPVSEYPGGTVNCSMRYIIPGAVAGDVSF